MNTTIADKINELEPDVRRRVLDTIEQLDNGRVYSIHFYADGSGVELMMNHPTINHGCPGSVMRQFDIETGLLILAGHRIVPQTQIYKENN